MAATRLLLREKKSEILSLAARHGAQALRVFGSVARGEDGPDSDIDLLVRLEDGRSLLDMIGLQQDMEDLLGRRVDVVSEGGLSPLIKDRVMADAVPL